MKIFITVFFIPNPLKEANAANFEGVGKRLKSPLGDLGVKKRNSTLINF
jgi:hypothetical protein